jgi:hypothetical protein
MAQTDTIIRYINSDFETPEDQQTWQSLPVDNSIKWIYATGGNGFEPPSAYSGIKNALFYWSAFDPYSRTLVSQAIDLSTAKKPELSFAHAMSVSVFGQDEMILLFRAGSEGTWDTIDRFTQEVPNWTLRTYNIKDYGLKYLTNEFYVAFKGISNSGDGVCIDKVVIEEKDIILRYPKSVSVHQINRSLIPRGISDIPVMRIDINIVGNTDPATLKSLVFKSLSSHDSLFKANGFELVATRDSVYKPTSLTSGSLKIGSATTISGGTVTFSNINFNLPTGLSSIWLIADIKSTAPHASIVDFRMDANSIVLNTSSGTNSFPGSVVSPAGVNYVEEAIVLSDFETGNQGWAFTLPPNDFEIAVPLGKVAHTSRDPDCAYGGTKVLGTDLTGDGRYLTNINAASAYYAFSPIADLKYYANVKLYFMKWFSFEANDHAVIEVSTDTAKTWTKIWDSKIDALIPDTKWMEYTLTNKFNDLAARKPWVQVRFGIIYSDNSFSYAGWNLDNFAITGNFLSNDVGITSLIKPISDCLNPGNDPVIIKVRNYAPYPTSSSLPVFFSIDGNTKVYDFIPGPIPVDGEVTFTFNQPTNIASPGFYDKFVVNLEIPGDEDPLNDTVGRDLFIQNSLSIPSYEKFEVGGGFWIPGGSSPTWECIIPEGGAFPPIPGSPKAWTLSPYGNYISNDTSFVISSCYDLVSPDSLLFEMKLWINSEEGKDGAAIEYSVDGGNTWGFLNSNINGYNWNWYNTTVTSLGTPGWSSITPGWKTVRQVLPTFLNDEPKVKFRVKWASDADNSYRGVAFDDVKIYSAPIDIGVSLIDSFANRCQGLNPDVVTVTIKNMGVNSLKENDTIIVGYDFNLVHATIDTFLLPGALLPGETIKHSFEGNIDVTEPGNYNLTAYTLVEKDPWFYNGNNDTVSLDFSVYPNPITSLTDTIQTHLPDTVVLSTYYNSDYDYWWNGESGASLYQVHQDGWQYLSVTATRGNGCTSYDSTNVELLFYDVGSEALVHPTDNCGFSSHEFPVVRVRNYGTDSIMAGQKIAVTFLINGSTEVEDTLELASTLYSGSTVDFIFTKGAVDLSAQGTYDFSVYTAYGGDTITSNNNITKSIEILGRPAVSLGPDITIEGLSHTLDAGPGYESYLWDNGAAARTREVTVTGSYWVQVYDANMCDNYDTAYVRLKIRDISPGSFESPLSDCEFSADLPVSLRVYNTGTDTVPPGSSIALSYRFNGESRVNDTMNLSQQLIPGAFAVYPFEGTVDLSVWGDYSLEATAVISGDLRPDNDTTTTTIYRYEKPVVDFGPENPIYVEDVSYVIEAGYSPHYAYQWQDTVTTHNYNVTNDGLYHVTVTDTRTSCYDRDTIFVLLIYSDIGVTWTSMPENGCTGVFDDLTVRVSNLGSSNIGSSAKVYVACDVNGERVTLDTLTWTLNFSPGTSIDLPLSGKVSIVNGGTSPLSFYTIFDEDEKPENDSMKMEFDALPGPIIDFGDVNGALDVDLPYVLDAGAGHQSYEWQDNSANQTYTVNTAGIYSVTVIGQNDCQSTKTVSINFTDGTDNFEAGKIVLYPNPSDGLFRIRMENKENEAVTVRIVNLSGQPVYNREMTSGELENEPIDVQHLARGVYLIQILTNNQVYTGRVIIQ